MAYLSVPSPGKWISDIFWKQIFFDNFLDHFLDPATKPRSRGFDPDLFMTELPCHQLGAKIKRVILTFRPGSTYQHQKNKFSCRCGERDLFLSPVPPVLPLIFFSEKRRFLEKRDPPKGSFLGNFWHFLSKCPNVIFFWGGGRRRRRDATTTKLRLPGPSPIAPRDRIPREEPLT